MNPLNYIQRAILVNEFTARKHVVCTIQSQARQHCLPLPFAITVFAVQKLATHHGDALSVKSN